MKNVALISVDDLMNVVRFRDAYGEPFQTPNIDRLLAMGSYFDGAHAVVPACNPSRTAAMTGLSPFHTGVEANDQSFFSRVEPETTMPWLFREAGYTTVGMGKVFHAFPEEGRSSAGLYRFLGSLYDHYEVSDGDRIEGNLGSLFDAIGPGVTPEEDLYDRRAVDWASHFVEGYDGDAPWFLTLGLVKPHLNWNVPQEYYDRFDVSRIVVPKTLPDDYDDVPLFYQQFLTGQRALHAQVIDRGAWVEGIHAYLAAVAYADAQLGRFLDALDAAGAWDDTTLVLWSDHGFHLGDQQVWGKFTHWERGTNAPLIIVDPDHGRPGTVIDTPVSLMDILPTLAELTGIEDGKARDGQSLVALLDDPEADWDGFAGSIMDGTISLRTGHYRYMLSLDGSEQLYDMRRDPEQHENLADKAGHGSTVEMLRARAVDDIDRLGGLADFDGRALDGTAGDDVLLVSPNLRSAAGADGNDLYLALDEAAIRETAGDGFDTLRLYGCEDGDLVRARVPDHVERVLAFEVRIDIEGSEQGDRVTGARQADRIAGQGGADRLQGGAGSDILAGGRAADRLDAGPGDDRVTGGAGSDHLSGKGGSDDLRGGVGGDRIGGGGGDDRLTGGGGADVFVIAGGTDRLTDFDPGRDCLDLRGLEIGGAGGIDWTATGEALVGRTAGADAFVLLEGLGLADLPTIDLLL
jgi:serralysin